MLAGLEPVERPAALRGRDITGLPANRRPTALVFQSLAFFDHGPSGENIEFAMKMKGVAPEAQKGPGAASCSTSCGCRAGFYQRPVTRCSGGERQRVALARALASDPEILFFDEPLSAIDYRLRKTLEVELKELHQRTGRTFVYITHSLEEAMVMTDRIAHHARRPDRADRQARPRSTAPRRDRFVAEFMGEVNILDAGPRWRWNPSSPIRPARTGCRRRPCRGAAGGPAPGRRAADGTF